MSAGNGDLVEDEEGDELPDLRDIACYMEGGAVCLLLTTFERDFTITMSYEKRTELIDKLMSPLRGRPE